MRAMVKKRGNGAASQGTVVMRSRPSVALSDQIKSLDWVVRRARRKGTASPSELAEVRAKISALIGAK